MTHGLAASGCCCPAAGARPKDPGTSIGEPARHSADDENGVVTPADALVELLAALARSQHEHRQITASRLTAVTEARLLPAGLHAMALYYLAKAQRDLGDSTGSRRGMQFVADGNGRLAPAGAWTTWPVSPATSPPPAPSPGPLGREGRRHRVEGDLHWPHGDMDRAAAAYAATRDEADQHGTIGERATSHEYA